MSDSIAQLTVGQKLWFVPSQRYKPAGEITVTKVGRKWAETEGHRCKRIDMETMREDSDVAPGRAYLSREDYNSKVEISKGIRALRNIIDRWGSSDSLTLDDIREVTRILKIEDRWETAFSETVS